MSLKGTFEVTSDIIYNFVDKLLKDRFDKPAAIPECHREWWDMACSKDKFVAIAAPRGHAKSTAITFSYVLASMVFHAKKFILIVSDTETQASMFLADIKKELMDNETLRTACGVKGLLKDTDSDFIVEFIDGFQARVIAKGSGQKLRGLKWDNYRPDLIIGDDLENEEIVLNADRREKFRRWFTGAMIPVLNRDGQIRVVGTVLHIDSQLNRLMPKATTKGVSITPLRIKSPKTSVWNAALYRAHPSMSDFSQTLWPEYKGPSELKAYQEHCRSEGLLDNYSAEILNDPMDPANARFSRADLLPMHVDDFNKHRNYYIGTDFAVTLDQRRDYTVFLVASVADDGMLMVEDVIRKRMDSAEIIETIIQLQQKLNPLFFAFEKGVILNTLMPGIRTRQFETDTFINYESFASSTDKDARASTIKARVRAHRVKFNKEADWWPAFEEELTKFPLGHDDQVDAFSILGNLINKIHRAETPDELREEEYEQFKNDNQYSTFGRSQITGY